jgi:hypothetical protein
MPAKTSLVLSPAQLQVFAEVDPRLPTVVTQAGIIERTQEYRYAMAALFCGLFAFVVLIAGFVYLVLQGHPKSAGLLLGAGVLGLVTGFVRARLSKAA